MAIDKSGMGVGYDTFDFEGQYALKSSVKLIEIKKDRSHAWITNFLDEQTIDGKACAGAVKYYYSSPAAAPGNWINSSLVSSPGANPYNYMIQLPSSPPGELKIKFEWKPVASSPSNPSALPGSTSQEGQGNTEAEWTARKVVLDEGLWVQVLDDSQLERGRPINKFEDIIDVLLSDNESAKRIGEDKIWESIKKRDGYIPAIYNPKIKPGDFIKTSLSQEYIFHWITRIRRIVFVRRGKAEQSCQYYIKERAFEGE